ncbi:MULTISPECIES: DUF4251 domain-containing protein [unclassified Lentimicrobium]|uniref:DUF4251 domain-containing protein n=1 Tax=unclassified Lentimicrobium TaxID=2677434 RepID=UPI0015538B9E|nr:MULTISPECIES: DUF4251 domain-containing protein [unclassified Lentimicrobium]NPD45672.1 DUF4251 domain-containing protein [Lentimicrobium sp. S6]NPD85551.1 DUF4251 domain-containing protein [Lentimicrobium sp. L6]
MKKFISILIILAFCFQVNAQETKSKKEIRAEKKAQEKAEQDEHRLVQEQWVLDTTFVLEAQRVTNKIGEVFQLNSTINFVYVNNGKATIQLGFDQLVGWNGVGGMTISGRITKYEIEDEKKNKPIFIRMSIQGSTGMQDLTIWISSNGNGEATIVDMRGNRIQFSGDIVSVDKTRTFKGMELY